jgi:radical SAM superfamily enzyme YgiQ (UPF0313 family)
MKNILLVNPDIESLVAPFEAITRLPTLDKRTFMTPLALSTLAALTPEDINVEIWDEAVQGRVHEAANLKQYDLVGVTGYVAHYQGAIRVARFFKRQGIPVAGGGPAVSASPERYRDDMDVLFIGEAEYTWPQFLADWQAGTHQKEYRQVIKPDVTQSPLPNWKSLHGTLTHYMVGGVQTTRGCPFDCEFCDVIFLYGRKPRHKTVDQVLAEVTALAKTGEIDGIFFCDDNFIGNPHYAKDLLKALIPVNNSFEKPIAFHTQVTLNVAKDDELLALMADANFGTLFIGIETPNKAALRETNKPTNYNTDIVADVHKILSYGLAIKGGMIVGFDHDDLDIFDQQFEFIQEACIPIPAINVLKIPVGTKLWSRMLKERRVIVARDNATRYVESIRAQTNLIPKLMTRSQLMAGYRDLLKKTDDWDSFAQRIKGFVSLIKRQPQVRPIAISEDRSRVVLQHLRDTVTDPKAGPAIFDILSHTRQVAPFMLRKVVGLVLQHLGAAEMSVHLQAALDKQIAMENAIPSYEPYIDRRPILIPDGFEAGYKTVFPSLYQKVVDHLADQSQLPEALIEVFTDFLTRWGEGFTHMEDHHIVALNEIADRTIAQRNEEQATSRVVRFGEGVYDAKQLMNQLRIEVLKSVERDLREHYGSSGPSTGDLIPIYGTKMGEAGALGA